MRVVASLILMALQADVPREQNWYTARKSPNVPIFMRRVNLRTAINLLDRILMPAFSTMNTRNMFDDMVDVISQLTAKWER